MQVNTFPYSVGKISSGYRLVIKALQWCHLACYAFLEINLALLNLLVELLVYLCQKSLNFIHALSSYKQKRKVVSFKLAHLVHVFLYVTKEKSCVRRGRLMLLL